MPSKKKKYNARFPAGRIKKIMQSDEEIGKVAQAVPVIISRTLELFVESLLTKTLRITNSRNAKTLSTSHMKQCIMSEQRFDFLRELVKNIPDISVAEEAANYNDDDAQSSPEEQYPDSDTPYDLSMPSTSTRATTAHRNTAVANGGNGNYYNRSHSHNGSSKTTTATAMATPTPNLLDLTDKRMPTKREWKDSIARADAAIAKYNVGHSTVIKHTTSIVNATDDYGISAKLSRSDSTPEQHQHHHRSNCTLPERRLHMGKTSSSSFCGNSNNNNKLTKQQSQQQQKQESPLTQPQTAIPAPIVSFDFCNKPVVKIDYSNLPISTASSSKSATAYAAANAAGNITPMSAPANIALTHTTSTAFNFNACEPVINIDLSNIVTNATTASGTSASSSVSRCGPAVATISIGSIPIATTKIETPPVANIAPKMLANAATTANTTTATFTPQTTSSYNPKASMATPLSTSNNKNITATAATCKSSFFELDEDYDNI